MREYFVMFKIEIEWSEIGETEPGLAPGFCLSTRKSLNSYINFTTYIHFSLFLFFIRDHSYHDILGDIHLLLPCVRGILLRVGVLPCVGECFYELPRCVGSYKIFNMSVSTDLNTLKKRVEALEADLDRSLVDFDYSVAQAQEYKDQYDQLEARHTALKSECADLKVDNRRLTRKLNEPDASFASPPIAAQPGEVAALRQRLAEKDQVIAARDEKYQSMLKAIEPLWINTLAISRNNEEAIQSCLAAMPKDAAKRLETLRNELAQGGSPPAGEADSKTSVAQGATKTPSDHADLKTSVTQGATKTPPERPASGSKRPESRQQSESSIEGPKHYSDVVPSKRAGVLRRGRLGLGQAHVPVSHEEVKRKDELREQKREEIQSKAGRSQKPNKAGFQPSQVAAGSSNITARPATKQDITGSQLPKKPHGASFVAKEELRSCPIPEEKLAGSPLPKKNWGASFVPRSSPIPEEKVADSQPPKQPHGASLVVKEKTPSSLIPEEKVVPVPSRSLEGTKGSPPQDQSATGPATQTDLGKITTPSPPTVTNPQIRGKGITPQRFSFNPQGDDDTKTTTVYKPGWAALGPLPPQESTSRKPVTQEPTSKKSAKYAKPYSWADDSEEAQEAKGKLLSFNIRSNL